VFGLLLWLVVAPAVMGASPPANDGPSHATAITLPFSESVDLAGATAGSADPNPCYNDVLGLWVRRMKHTVWYRVPAGPSLLLVEAAASKGRPVIAAGAPVNGHLNGDCLYTGRSDLSGHMIVNDTQEGLVVVGLADDVPATVDVRISALVSRVAPNDNWHDAVPIEQIPFRDSLDGSTSSVSPDDPNGCAMPTRTVWYNVRPFENKRLSLSVSGAAASISFLRRSGGSWVTLRCESAETNEWSGPWRLTGGVTTYLMIGTNPQPGDSDEIRISIPDDPLAPTPPWETVPTAPPTTTAAEPSHLSGTAVAVLAGGLLVAGCLLIVLRIRPKTARRGQARS
jgi:hypothetical protein